MYVNVVTVPCWLVDEMLNISRYNFVIIKKKVIM